MGGSCPSFHSISSDLNAFEIAYSYLTEARIASERGNRVEQLGHFRKAMLNDGRWLARDNYLSCLRATVILEIEQEDFVTAIRDYELLTETEVGRNIAADLEGSIQTIKARIDRDGDVGLPYMVANSIVTVKRKRKIKGSWDGFRSGTHNTWPSDDGLTPPRQPPNKQ